jgi:hypothetical protein
VKVRRSGLRLLHRAATLRRIPEQEAEAAALSALLAPPAAGNYRVELAWEAPSAGATGVPVSLRLPLEAFTLVPEGTAHRGRIGYFLALEDPRGGFRRLEPRWLDARIPNAQLAEAFGQSLSFRVELPLGPGVHRVAVAVLDEPSGARYLGVSTLDIPAAR